MDLYLLSILSYGYYIIIYRTIGAPDNVNGTFDGLNAIEYIYISTSIFTDKFPETERFGNKMLFHTSTQTEDISIVKYLQK